MIREKRKKGNMKRKEAQKEKVVHNENETQLQNNKQEESKKIC